MQNTTTSAQLYLCPDHFHLPTTLEYAPDTLQRCLACVTGVFAPCKAWIEHQVDLGLALDPAEHSR